MTAPEPVTHDDIDSIAAWTVIRAARELARMLEVELRATGLSPVEFGVLAQLAAADGLSQAELARAVGVRPQSMTTLTASLIGRSLIARGVEAGRGRHSRIGLTDTGRALLADAWPVVTASNDWFGADHTRVTNLVGLLQPMLGSTHGSD
ncbi:MarR family winged helix-turn-helix transcriptional regulator [Clavibacter sp. Sh2141]|uniref:MarR family winged helix-turn-helix transcriptional regulator n=1 Tax=Clavibacter sp. Sh2141 TaxID=3395374 RepID=UPI0039BC29AD